MFVTETQQNAAKVLENLASTPDEQLINIQDFHRTVALGIQDMLQARYTRLRSLFGEAEPKPKKPRAKGVQKAVLKIMKPDGIVWNASEVALAQHNGKPTDAELSSIRSALSHLVSKGTLKKVYIGGKPIKDSFYRPREEPVINEASTVLSRPAGVP